MPLNLSRVAYGCASVADLEARLAARAAATGANTPIGLTTRYKPKRWEETAGGSLYWIIAHKLVARSPLVGFADSPPQADGKNRTDICILPKLILVRAKAKRAHQGWRYMEDDNAPADLSADADTSAMPASLVQELSGLGLV
jgi:hypothetical protein